MMSGEVCRTMHAGLKPGGRVAGRWRRARAVDGRRFRGALRGGNSRPLPLCRARGPCGLRGAGAKVRLKTRVFRPK